MCSLKARPLQRRKGGKAQAMGDDAKRQQRPNLSLGEGYDFEPGLACLVPNGSA
jgi:hypothetical protein